MFGHGREVLTFLAVGGWGYLVDIAVFNVTWGVSPFDRRNASIAKAVAAAAAMICPPTS